MLDIIVNPFITILLFLYKILGGNVVLAIVVFTILVRLATYPLTAKQQRSTKAMQALQPELKKLQEKYKNDSEKRAQAQMALYKEYGVNPFAGCLPLLIQFPIIIALYRAITATLAATPLQLLDLAGRSWVPSLASEIPLANRFLWLNLAVPDPLYILPILVLVTTWLQQKLLMPPPKESENTSGKPDPTAAMTKQMMIIMPLMFGFFSLSFASGLSIYFIVSNLIGIGQGMLTGKVDMKRMSGRAVDVPPVTPPLDKSKRKRTELAAETVEAEKPKRSPVTVERSVDRPALKAKRPGISDTRANRARKAKG